MKTKSLTVESSNEGVNGAEYFFENVSCNFCKQDLFSIKILIRFILQIMKLTSTRIHWPCRLKIGAKTKKGKI